MAPDRRVSYSPRPAPAPAFAPGRVDNGMSIQRAQPDCATLFRRASASPLDDRLWDAGVKAGCAKFGVKGGIQGGRKSRRRKTKKTKGGRKSRKSRTYKR